MASLHTAPGHPSSNLQYLGVLVFSTADGRLGRADDKGAWVALRPQAASLLKLLLEQHGEVVSRDSLIAAIWNDGRVVDYEAGLAALVSELRGSMERLEPGSASWLETIPRRGLRLQTPDMRSPDQQGKAPAIPIRHQAIRHWVVGLAIALLVAALLLTWTWQETPQVSPSLQSGGTVAVLPFELFGTAESAVRFDLIAADRFLGSLWTQQLEAVSILGRASVQAYASRDDLIQVLAADLAVDWIVEGSVTFANTQRGFVEARLLSLPGGQVVWSDSIAVGGSDQLGVGEGAAELAERLAVVWRSAMSHER